METSNLKNMVVLKNLPSNLVEEAIVILKSNKKVKKLEKIEKARIGAKQEIKMQEQGYIVKEAEMLVSQYLTKLENKNQKDIFNKNVKRKYKLLKKYASLASLLCVIEMILLFLK